MKQAILFTLLMICIAHHSFSQKGFTGFVQYYPISEDPSIGYKTTYVSQETLLFEGNPVVRYSLYNNFVKRLLSSKAETWKDHPQAWYISFRPQIRMYNDSSMPVRTPSYRILLGTQHLFRRGDNTIAFSLESGHYSNGQTGSSFSDKFTDGSKEGDSLYTLIADETNLSDILNRRSGNFSTNLTEFIVSHHWNKMDDDRYPERVHALSAGLTLYHDNFLGIFPFGGYSEPDIKIYGRTRWMLGYDFTKVWIKKNKKPIRLSISERIELINGAHKSVNPFRSETVATVYPFPGSATTGFYLGFITGHDNYNYRFVDSGSQLTVGISWASFPPVEHRKTKSASPN
jgi:hypothetical protein